MSKPWGWRVLTVISQYLAIDAGWRAALAADQPERNGYLLMALLWAVAAIYNSELNGRQAELWRCVQRMERSFDE